jgi:xylan 1,4-beta-xylosidase
MFCRRRAPPAWGSSLTFNTYSSAVHAIATATAIGLTACAALCASPARADAVGLRTIAVDATVPIGALRPLSGVNGAPGAEFGRQAAGEADAAAGVDGAPFYRDARIDLVRIHNEFGPGDIDAIFPDMNADPDNPKSYDFARTDRLIASIKGAGAEPLFRLGRSLGAAPDPPPDLDKYAKIAAHIVLHYNLGWDRGFKHAIRYWEIWNEPDSKRFWNGSAPQYYALYEKVARAIEDADPEALVGGPALARPLDGGAYREGLIDFIRLHRLPLDFFSWHFYPVDIDDPYDFVTIARQLRIILDAHGFGSALNVLDEWNADLTAHDMSAAARAAFAASALIYMLGGPIDHQTFCRGDSALRTAGGAPNAIGHALSAFGQLKDTPVLLHTDGGDDAGFALVAGGSADRRLVKILISNYQVSPEPSGSGDALNITLPVRRTLEYRDNGGYEATITLPTAKRYRVKRYRISDSANFTLVDQTVQTGPNIHLQAALPPPGIELIVIEAN